MFYEFMFEYLFCVIFIRSEHLSLWRFAQFLLPSWGVLLQSLVEVLMYYFSHVTLPVLYRRISKPCTQQSNYINTAPYSG